MAKRIATSSARWAYIAENMLPQDQQRIAALKSVSDTFSRMVSEKPSELPKIDWAYYKSRISVPGMVETFQKSYESLKIPYPSDQGALSTVEASNDKMLKHAEEKYKQLLQDIEKVKKVLEEKEKIMKYSDMTLEEYILLEPLARPNNPEQPYFWPYMQETESKNDEKDH